MATKNIGLVGGFASTNVGNDFFTKGIEYAITRAVPDSSIYITQNLPGYYWKEGNKNPKNSFNYLGHMELDYLILTGPLFDVRFPHIWEETLSTLKNKGTRILIFSAGSQQYSENERNTVSKFLEFVEPYAIISRDSPTYEAYKELAEYSYDGIDFAFFINDIFKPYKLDLPEYVILNFDTMPEPVFRPGGSDENSFRFLGEDWRFKKKQMNKVNKTIYRFFPEWFTFHNQEFGKYEIVRPYNFVNPGNSKKFYTLPGTYLSELASDHVNLYANASGILSCRVHSCVASLVFGKEAMLFSKSLRGQLFDRVGLGDIRKHPVKLDLSYLKDEKKKQLEFLKKIFA
ncbi:MAG: polysaccharide pyruvyl transferase family protein [Bacteroidales bacterium]|jgi:hypothetical protein|nr:polysaccharide pyruvyl transferase family protein [Bacteroidales bacterium]